MAEKKAIGASELEQLLMPTGITGAEVDQTIEQQRRQLKSLTSQMTGSISASTEGAHGWKTGTLAR